MISEIKQILDFNKKAFDDNFSTVVAVQEHLEKMICVFCEKSLFIPKKSRKVIGDCFKTYKNGLNDFKSKCDSRFKIIESYILNAADQMESSKKETAEKTVLIKNVDQATKKVSTGIKKAAPRKRVVKNKILTVKKGKQK
jgi:hypothetical protein